MVWEDHIYGVEFLNYFPFLARAGSGERRQRWNKKKSPKCTHNDFFHIKRGSCNDHIVDHLVGGRYNL